MIKIVIGGQFGSEGKGEVCSWMARREKFDLVIRLASPNSGHTFTIDGKKHITRHLPSTWLSQDTTIYIPSGSIINNEILSQELSELTNYKSPIVVSPYATLVNKNDVGNSTIKTGTTNQGVGETRAKLCLREAKQFGTSMEGYITVMELLNNQSSNILIESSQGFGLSLHSQFYPYCTSTDIMPYQILQSSDIPFGIHQVEVWLVIRTMPIRVAGNSGPLKSETSWDNLNIQSEYTTVTKKIRRIGCFDHEQVVDAINRCRPDKIILTFKDYHKGTVKSFEDAIAHSIDYISVGPGEIIPRERLT